MKYIIGHANQESLVIIDEPGLGTDPDEGVALAMAVLDLLSQRGTFVAVSTHSNRLKSYGLLNKQARNASVEFDVEKNCPSFRIKYGSPGISHALEIAQDMGMSISILDTARKYLSQDEVQLNRLIEKLNGLMAEAKHEKSEGEKVRKKYHSAAKKLKDRLITLEADKRALMEAKRLEAETAIKEAGEELKQAINWLKKKKEPAQAYVTERYAEISSRLMDHLELEANEKPTVELKEVENGQFVYHKKLKQKGIVQSVDVSTGRALVMLGNVKVSAEIQDLKAVSEAQEAGLDEVQRTVSWELKAAPQNELNVIGCMVDEAIPLIDKTIDRALVDGKPSLTIIHGFGTGRLREAIRAHLKDIPFVKKTYSADSRFGGDAITVVELS